MKKKNKYNTKIQSFCLFFKHFQEVQNRDTKVYVRLTKNKYISGAGGDFSVRGWCPKKDPSFLKILFFAKFIDYRLV